MNIEKYTLAMIVSEDSLLDTDDLLRIANVFENNNKIDIVICQNDEEYSCRYRGLVRGTVQLAAYITDSTEIIPSLTAVINNPKTKGLGKGFILVNRSTLSKYNEHIEKEELIQALIEDITNSINWIENL